MVGHKSVRLTPAAIEDSDLKLSYDLYYLRHFSTWLDLVNLASLPSRLCLKPVAEVVIVDNCSKDDLIPFSFSNFAIVLH